MAPILVFRQEPEYSEEARAAKLQGTVLVSLVVGEDGQPRNVRVRKSLGLGLDENAVEAVSRWRFRAGTKDGQPVAVESSIGGGSTFTISLPIAKTTGSATTIPAQAPAVFTKPAGSKRVLLVEDDDDVRGFASEVLNRAGFEVLPARHGLDDDPRLRHGAGGGGAPDVAL